MPSGPQGRDVILCEPDVVYNSSLSFYFKFILYKPFGLIGLSRVSCSLNNFAVRQIFLKIRYLDSFSLSTTILRILFGNLLIV